jgi:hypothetical protein
MLIGIDRPTLAGLTSGGAAGGWTATIINVGDIIGIMPAPRRTKLELEAETTRLATEVEALRKFVFEIDLGQANLRGAARGVAGVPAATPGA